MLADGEYDAIVMGTGLKEAIMSGLLSTLGMKVRVGCWCWPCCAIRRCSYATLCYAVQQVDCVC